VAYRDDLTAAMARIHALQDQLASEGTVDEQVAELRARNLQLEREIARLKREVEDLSERLYGRVARAEVARMRSLPDHNRQWASRLNGLCAAVVCPSCLATGERVEMVRPDVAAFPETDDLKAVICPACAMLGLLRLG